ncbi:MAG TPA: hypothetical protein VH275_11265 [Solirubrobacterales bacterium]|jgi:hypothetical protein|nr:hypothetical protein [Solirubrobacterales bacterium]
MTQDLAARLADRWYEECEQRQLATDPYHALRQGLQDFLPVDAKAGIAYRDDSPFVLALATGALLLFAPPTVGKLVDVVALPVSSLRSLSVSCEHTSGMHANYRVCTWGMTDDQGVARSHVTRSVVGNGFDSDNGGEGVMLALADRMGWSTPISSAASPG